MSEWIEWNGGECPVSHDALVDIELNCGITGESITASTLYWDHIDGEFGADIVRYREVSHGH